MRVMDKATQQANSGDEVTEKVSKLKQQKKQ